MNALRRVASVALIVLACVLAIAMLAAFLKEDRGVAFVLMCLAGACVVAGATLEKQRTRALELARRVAMEAAQQARLTDLVARFGADAGPRIMLGEVWQGMDAEMLVASIGLPVARDEHVLKTKRKDVFKYHQIGANRFAMRVHLENGIVVGWER